jgi:1,4-alpha-glucan branching enzyme
MAQYADVVFYLHAHLPYLLGHGTWPHGSVWLYEAAAEVYLPLLRRLRELAGRGVPLRLGVGFTPTLVEQLGDPRFEGGFREYLRGHAAAAADDARGFEAEDEPHLAGLARVWEAELRGHLGEFDRLGGDLLRGFRELAGNGFLESVAGAATHGYLPLLGREDAVARQVRLGLLAHGRHLGGWTGGFWLPECAYRPGREWRRPFTSDPPSPREGTGAHLDAAGVRYTFVDAHLIEARMPEETPGDPVLLADYEDSRRQFRTPYPDRSPYGVYAPDSSAFRVLVRDFSANRQVWDGFIGYPGDVDYREFHRRRWPSGLRYWRVTGKDVYVGHKAPYDPEAARARVREHARHYVGVLEGLAAKAPGDRAVLTLPFDCELFGHWWYEGPEWLSRVLEGVAGSERLTPASPSEVLERAPAGPVVLREGSWGYDGYHKVWLGDHARDYWDAVYSAEDRLAAAAREHGEEHRELARRLLAAAARELLLLEASDWPFLIYMHSARDYARVRYNQHREFFHALVTALERMDGGGVPPEAEELLARREANAPFGWATWEELR